MAIALRRKPGWRKKLGWWKRHAERALWPLLAVGFVALLLACVLIFPRLLVNRALQPGQQLTPAERVKAENDVRATLLQGVGGLLLLAGAYTAWRQYQHNLGASRQELHLSREGQITERFSRAIDQLDYAKSLEVRLGAIYALERIARDSEPDHWPIMEVLTTYVREHAIWKEGAKQREPKPTPDIQAILTVLGRRARTFWRGEDQRLNLSATDLRGANLAEAHLEGAHLTGAHLEGAKLWGAHLEEASLGGAHLEGAHLTGAHLEEALLVRAHLEDAILDSAHLERAHLEDAHLRGAELEGAHLEGANLERAHLEGAHLALVLTDEKTRLPAHLAHLLPPTWMRDKMAPGGADRPREE